MVIKEQRSRLREKPDNAQEEKDVADARRQECFFCCGCGRRLLVPESNEQVRRKTYDLPGHEQQQNAIRDHNAQHRSRKKREEAEEARVVFVVGHVTNGVDEDQQANEGHHDQHD